MNLLMVTAKIKEENVADARAAVEKLIAALEREQPSGVRYASGLLKDGVTLVAFLEMAPGQEHPLQTFPAYQELLEGLGPWRAEPASADFITVLGSHHLF
ncbi:MAG TPA: hypothetical protein VF070_24790 [Streptosporangiaceae bacterium]